MAGRRQPMGTSKQAGVEFQQCGKQQTLQSVQEQTSVAGVPARCGSRQQGRVSPPRSDGTPVGGLTPRSYRKHDWSRNINKHSQRRSVMVKEEDKFWTTSWRCVDKNFRGFAMRLPLTGMYLISDICVCF